jgi:hypothetical protein
MRRKFAAAQSGLRRGKSGARHRFSDRKIGAWHLIFLLQA